MEKASQAVLWPATSLRINNQKHALFDVAKLSRKIKLTPKGNHSEIPYYVESVGIAFIINAY